MCRARLLVLCGLLAAGVVADINKCCPEGQMLDLDLNCVDFAPGGDHGDDRGDGFSWFPRESVVESSPRGEPRSYPRDLGHRINYGKMPECSDAKQFAYHRVGAVEWFNFVVDANGGLRVHVSKPSSFHDPENASLGRTIPPEDACVDVGLLDIHIMMFCPCRTLLCIRKCCAEKQHFAIESFGCEDNEFDVPGWRPRGEGIPENYYLLSDTYPSCDIPILLKYQHEEYSSCNRYNKASDNHFTIYSNGSLKVNKYKTLFDASQYCGEVTVSRNGTVEEQNLILCSASKTQAEEDAYEPVTHTLYGVLLIVGGICLLATVAVSLFLPSLRRKVHNKIALSHNASLMVANFTWAVPQLSTGLGSRTCIVLAFLEQFTLLGSFFWLNVMCIDISMTFSSNRHLKSGRLDGGNKKFVYYNVYAWGLTTLISVATLAMEYNPDASLDYLKPGFACICGFNTANASMLIYLYGPMTILLSSNLALFVYTTIKIVGIQRQTAMLRKQDSNTTGGSSFQTDKQRYDPMQRLILYGKLFLLMGITWIMEIVSWAVGGPSYYWYFSDTLNLLRAVFIFILFICKRQVFKSVRKKLAGDWQWPSEKTGSAKSQTDEMVVSSTAAGHASKATGKRKGSNRSEMEFRGNAPLPPSSSSPTHVLESGM